MPILDGAFGRKLEEIKKGAMEKIKNPGQSEIDIRLAAVEANVVKTNKIIKQLAGKGIVELKSDKTEETEMID